MSVYRLQNYSIWCGMAGLLLLICTFLMRCTPPDTTEIVRMNPLTADTNGVHEAPDTSTIPDNEYGKEVRYGRDLIMRTAYYLGPEGKVGKYLGSKMNCTNCHLEGGTKPYGLNFFSTHGRYPQFRARENRILTLADRINNCIERPLNGKPLPLDSREILAMQAYMRWLAEGVPVGKHVKGDQLLNLEFPDYKLDVHHGKRVYDQHCARCHGDEGEGKWLADQTTYEYPPLWGIRSYQQGAGMYRIIRAAAFIKANMPQDKSSWENPLLTDQEAFNVAAFINSEIHERLPRKDKDYPDFSKKPIDYPFGPYNDPFSEEQHKYGPYEPIIDYRTRNGLYVHY